MNRVYAIALNTFREAVRDRILYGMVGASVAVILFTLALAELSLNQQTRIITDVGLSAISLFSVLISIFLGSSLLYKEIERKTLYVILSKPISRWEFLLGKFLGIALTALVFVTIMGTVQLWVAELSSVGVSWLLGFLVLGMVALIITSRLVTRDRTVALAFVSVLAFVASIMLFAGKNLNSTQLIVASTALTIGEVLVLAAIALLFSSFSSPFLTGVFTFGVWLIGRSADDMIRMKTNVIGPEIKTLLRVLAEVVPNFNLFVPGRHALSPRSGYLFEAWRYVGVTLTYAVLYAAIALIVASVIFRRRDLL